MQFDKDIKSQEDLANKNIEGVYMGTAGTAINEDNGQIISYNQDGTTTSGHQQLNSVTVTPTHGGFWDGVDLGIGKSISWVNHNMNPGYIIANGIYSSFTGRDWISGAPTYTGQGAVELAMLMLPVGRVGKTAESAFEVSMERAVMNDEIINAARKLNLTTSSNFLLFNLLEFNSHLLKYSRVFFNILIKLFETLHYFSL